jgi:hypothetical protein
LNRKSFQIDRQQQNFQWVQQTHSMLRSQIPNFRKAFRLEKAHFSGKILTQLLYDHHFKADENLVSQAAIFFFLIVITKV